MTFPKQHDSSNRFTTIPPVSTLPANTLLFGGAGRLASYLIKTNPNIKIFSKKELDIRNKEALFEIVKRENPSLIINCAAITDVVYCEKNPKECWKVNADSVRDIVDAAENVSAKVVHVSSNYAIDPVNVYGQTKAESERIVGEMGLVIRTAIYDTKTFIIRKLLFTKDNLFAYNNVYFNPIYMGTLSNFLSESYEKKGIINVATKEKLSCHEFALKVCEVFTINKSRVRPIPFSQDTRVKRPTDIFLESCLSISTSDDLKRFKNDLDQS